MVSEKKKILIVDDEEEIAKLIAEYIQDDYIASTVGTVAEAHKAVESFAPDLIVLDINLPDGTGLGLCQELQEKAETKLIPIIFLSGRCAADDKVKGLKLGALDYLGKPFDLAELKIRIDVRLKEREASEFNAENLLGNLMLNLTSRRAFHIKEGKEVPLNLTPTEFNMLFLFVTKKNQILERNMIISSVWGPKVAMSSRTVDTHISKLRKKIDALDYQIRPVHGTGYKLKAVMVPSRKRVLN